MLPVARLAHSGQGGIDARNAGTVRQIVRLLQ